MSNSNTTYQFQVNHEEESEPSGSSASVNSFSSPNLDPQYPDSIGADLLSIALIGPDEERRNAVASALAECRGAEVREFSSYPPGLDDVPRLLEQYYDVIIIDLDSNPEYALELVESICAKDTAIVMVFSATPDRDLVVRCMRAGAREYLTLPFDQSTVAEALVRAAATLDPATRPAKKTRGRLRVFLGAKGGSGVTTIACNFAVALAQESGQSTLLIDLGLPMGDAALNLGIAAEYSTDNALLDAGRLDSSFLSKLLVKHRSGVYLLAAPSKVPKIQASNEAIDKLMAVAREDFANVIVDVGSRLDLTGTALFKEALTIYLVTQAGISELRNSNRLISQFFTEGSAKLEIVINRFESRSLGVSEEQISKALTRPVQWKIPDDYATARRTQNTATPLALEDSPISRAIHQMARTACGLPENPEKKTGFSFRSLSRSIAEKISTTEETPSIIKETPTITWSTPAPITHGTVLSTAQLNAEASVPGAFAYTPGAGYVLPAGTHTLWVTFTPTDTAGVTTVQAAASITVTKATPTIKWPTPPAVSCGKALSTTQLNATASVPGTFVYTPAAGDVLTAGTHELSVTFTPTDATNYTTAQATVSVTVAKATPAIAWPTPAPITCGAALSTAQFNATAPVPGTFVYTPAAGDVLTAGRHTLSVTFTPTDTADYTTAQATVSLAVGKVTPAIAWPTPAPITYGTVLSTTQLDATASAPGTFVYTPAAGDVLTAGTHELSVTFTPTDATNYTTAQAAVSVTVAKATPAVAWPTPAPITFGTALSTAQLNARASVPGTFVYAPAAGDVLTAGRHTLSVTFTPTDSADYTTAQATVSVTVAKATPAIAWPTPAPITYGTVLSTTQLDATASVPGTFLYIPAVGAVLAAGTHTPSVTFTTTDTTDYTTAQAAVSLTVAKATPTITWPTPAPITDGTPLRTTQLNATASVPGTFVYTPAAGDVLTAGPQKLSVTFTPTDATNYTTAQATVSLTVTKTTPTVIAWPTPSVISYGTALSTAQLNATASVPGTFVYTPAAGDVLTAGRHALSAIFTPTDTAKYAKAQATVALVVEGLPNIASLLRAATRTPFTATDTADFTDLADAKWGALPSGSTPDQNGEPETRTYKGATYEKGEDGQWHLQQK
jgi:Flp pilus assembly CpaE family ATPase